MRQILSLLALAVLFVAHPAWAHLTPDSQITLIMSEEKVVAQVTIPASEYSYASGHVARNSPASLQSAKAYLANNAKIEGVDGRRWTTTIEMIEFAQVEGPEDLIATLTFRPSANGATDRFVLNWTAVIDETGDHFATVRVRQLGEGGEARLAGLLRQGNTTLLIKAGRSSVWAQFVGSMKLGAQHIVGGLDHLAFLLALLLASPMVAEGKRWTRIREKSDAIRSLVVVATGFTIGHSLSLIGVVTSGLTLRPEIIEPAIAITVLVAAVHALRPLFARKEILVATGFGLIHGLGFAGFVQQADAQVARSLPTLVGFNLGIELVQVAIVATFIPLLFLLIGKGVYARVRSVVAVAICTASSWWIATRTGMLPL